MGVIGFIKEHQLNVMLFMSGICGVLFLLTTMTGAFLVLDKVPEKKRGTGAVVCCCPQPGLLRENILQIPVWFI